MKKFCSNLRTGISQQQYSDSLDLSEYLRSRSGRGRSDQDDAEVEYRLICSGTVHRELLGDWTKSDVARVLLDGPVWLFVSSAPIDEMPQEITARLSIGFERLGSAESQLIIHSDDEVVEDLAAFLSVMFRRLVTVLVKTRTVLLHDPPGLTPTEWPNPVYRLRPRHWTPRGISLLRSTDGSVVVKDAGPQPVSINPDDLSSALNGLRSPNAAPVLRAIRLYASALELIEERTDVGYLLLVSAIETLAASSLSDWVPDDDERARHQRRVSKLAEKLEIPAEKGRQLAIEATKSEYWISRKFVKFISDRVGDEIWSDDDLFPLNGIWEFDHTKLNDYLRSIYRIRSLAVHTGEVLPRISALGTTRLIDARLAFKLLADRASSFPPVGWFERIVNLCLRRAIADLAV